MLFEPLLLEQGVHPGQLLVGDLPLAFGQCAIDMPFHDHIDVASCRHPQANRLSQQTRISQQALAQHVVGPIADQAVQLTTFSPALNIGKQVANRRFENGPVVSGHDLLGIAAVGDIQLSRIEGDFQAQLGLPECGVALADDTDEQQRQKDQCQKDGQHAVDTESALRGATSAEPLVDQVNGPQQCLGFVTHIAPDTC